MSFYKMLLKNTIIMCTVFSLIITVCISIMGYNYIKNEYVSEADAAITHISNSLEYNLLQVQELPVLFKANSSFKNYVEDSVLSSEDKDNIYRYLRSTISSMPNTRYSIAVSKIDDNMVISNISTSTLDFFMESYNISESDMNGIMKEFDESTFVTTSTLVSKKGDSSYLTVFSATEPLLRRIILLSRSTT